MTHFDKVLHFVVGACTAAVGSLHSVELALVLCVGAALGKEALDERPGRSGWDWWDVSATVAGGVAVLVVFSGAGA